MIKGPLGEKVGDNTQMSYKQIYQENGLCSCGQVIVQKTQSLCEKHRLIKQRQGSLSRYKITEKFLQELETKANGHCMICGNISDLEIDHDHETGEVRGLLCHICNTSLGSWINLIPYWKQVDEYLGDSF